jgi:hypothetical protein
MEKIDGQRAVVRLPGFEGGVEIPESPQDGNMSSRSGQNRLARSEAAIGPTVFSSSMLAGFNVPKEDRNPVFERLLPATESRWRTSVHSRFVRGERAGMAVATRHSDINSPAMSPSARQFRAHHPE